jgi:proline dehydrogenase
MAQAQAGLEVGARRFSVASIPRNIILGVTQNPLAARWAQRCGARLGASRFVAGEEVEDCVAVLRELDARGLLGYAIKLGESVTDTAQVARTVETYRVLARRLAAERLATTMSLKLTHVGLAIDERLAYEAAHEIIAEAASHDVFVRLDMEDSRMVDGTLATYRRLRDAGLSNTGVVLQAYLHRTLADLESLLELDLNVRVVKGAYLEPPSVAFAHKRDVDRNYRRLIEAALEGAAFTAIATHDDQAIAHAAAHLGPSPGSTYEFQMLYGVRPQLQDRLVAAGHPVRVCVPYGPDWFVYFGRRLAERPANVLFVLRSLITR